MIPSKMASRMDGVPGFGRRDEELGMRGLCGGSWCLKMVGAGVAMPMIKPAAGTT